jgi:hypothetical protein
MYSSAGTYLLFLPLDKIKWLGYLHNENGAHCFQVPAGTTLVLD